MKQIPKETILRASRGDMEAFKEIYDISSGFVYTVVYRIVRNSEDAQEVTQDVFMSIYQKINTFRFKSSLKTWLYRIATNRAINMYRKRAKEKGRKVTFEDNIKYDSDVFNKTAVNFEREHAEKLVKAMLGSLPCEQRACIVLKDIEGLRYQEIAEVLGIKINTVRSRLKRAREKLLALKETGESSHEM
ncbi:MAG: sigma-70 family RNA polymerase sigma factor [Candidatus Omnitrophica bacterium]|nr:sigma-70 family RNA polymerase sigma factor [Candidatus Omnitrophota bacterium]